MKFKIGESMELEWAGGKLAAKISGENGKEMSVQISLPKQSKEAALKVVDNAAAFLEVIKKDLEGS